jgi:hypothetical protein
MLSSMERQSLDRMMANIEAGRGGSTARWLLVTALIFASTCVWARQSGSAEFVHDAIFARTVDSEPNVVAKAR